MILSLDVTLGIFWYFFKRAIFQKISNQEQTKRKLQPQSYHKDL